MQPIQKQINSILVWPYMTKKRTPCPAAYSHKWEVNRNEQFCMTKTMKLSGLTVQKHVSSVTIWKGQCVHLCLAFHACWDHYCRCLFLWISYGQVSSMAQQVCHQSEAEQQEMVVMYSVTSSKKMLMNKKARAKSSRYVQSVSGCHALNVRSWSGPTVNSQEGMSGYAKLSTDDSPAADICTTAGQMWEIMSL